MSPCELTSMTSFFFSFFSRGTPSYLPGSLKVSDKFQGVFWVNKMKLFNINQAQSAAKCFGSSEVPFSGPGP